MAFIQKTPGEAHWSKDYIEHLRTVHFALIVAAITGIALSRVPNSHDLMTAQHDMHSFRSAMSAASTRILVEGKGPVAQNSAFAENWYVFEFEGKKYFTEDILLRPYYIFEGCKEGYRETKTTYNAVRSGFSRLQTMDQLIRWWNSLNCEHVNTYSPVAVGTQLEFEDKGIYIPLKLQQAIGTELLSTGYIYTPLSRYSSNAEEDTRKFDESHGNLTFDPSFEPTKNIGSHIMKVDTLEVNVHYRTLKVFVRCDIQHGLQMDATPWFDTRHWQKGAAERQALFRRFEREQTIRPGEWDCYDEFSKCFYALNRVAEERRGHEIKDLCEEIDGEVSRNERQFELFGIKFPTEDLSLWGIVLIIMVLGYFSLHLRELSPKMQPTDSGLEVAWLGLYSSWYSVTLFWLSVLVLPCLAVYFLGLEGAQYIGPLRDALKSNWENLALWIALPMTLSVVIGVSCCRAARRLAILASSARSLDEKSVSNLPKSAD